MKSGKLTIVIAAGALLAVAGGSAFASDKWLGDQGQDHIVSTKTRAQVIAELKEAREQGLIVIGDDPNYPRLPAAKSTRSRAEVCAEAMKAAKNRKFNPDYDVGG